MPFRALAALAFASIVSSAAAAAELKLPLDSAAGLEVMNGRAAVETHRGKRSLRLMPEGQPGDADMMAVVTGSDFHDGTIELDVAGDAYAGAPEGVRGFIGLAFRVQSAGDKPRFECFYIRPLNARSDDQLQRNHSAQYVAAPDWTWRRLRAETPGKYEAYVDLEPGAWTHLKVVVSGSKARLFVGDNAQPTLVINDLKLGDSRGAVALWSHQTTDGFFRDLKVY